MSFKVKKYKLLSQTIDDDFVIKERFPTKNQVEVEDDFEEENASNSDDAYDVSLMSQPMFDMNKINSRIQKRKKKTHHSKLISFFFFLIITAVLVLIIFVFGFDKSIKRSVTNVIQLINLKYFNSESNEWSFEMESYGTESCIRLYDVDEDGLDDLIFGLAGIDEINRIGISTEKNEGTLMAVRGTDGTILWKISTKSEIFELNCLIDIDLDGRYDCIGTGRKHTFVAFDPHDGKVYWDVSFKLNLNDNWNIYNPIIVPYDLDNDKVFEIVISIGGDPTIPSNVHKRESGRIMMYSGRTGTLIGQELILPEDKETYMSPVLHTQKDGSSYILIGSGGETIPGYLYIISLPNFYKYVTKKSSYDFKFNGSYKSNEKLKNFINNDKIEGLYTLYSSTSKGIMVPPVFADVNQDGTKDILMLSFDGVVALFDGATFNKIWEKKFECHETYTSPSPGYFNDDNILDFMLIQNLGTFDYYLNASILILNGLDGSILWQMNMGRMQMISPLTIQTSDESIHRDLFFFRGQGIEFDKNMIHQVYHGIEPQQPIDKSPNKINNKRDKTGLGLESNHEFEKCQKLIKTNENQKFSNIIKPDCKNDDFNDGYISTFGFILDRTIQDQPIEIFKSSPGKLIYNFTQEELKLKDQELKTENLTTCVVMEPMERNTGAIGYLTSKEELDIVTIITNAGIITHPQTGNYVKIVTNMKVFKNSLKNSIKTNKRINKEICDDLIVKKTTNKLKEKEISELDWKKSQSWTAYMGSKSDSSFE